MGRMVFGIALVACVLSSACRKSQSLDGTWSGGAGMGSFTFTGENFKYEVSAPGYGIVTMTGMFTMNGDKLTFTPTDAAMQMKDTSQQAEATKEMDAAKPMFFNMLTQYNPYTITWQDNDHITITDVNSRAHDMSRLEVQAAQ